MGLARKIKRKQQGIFMKEFKKKMRHFKKMVKCTICGRPPMRNENIDDWQINQQSENLDLVCRECFGPDDIEPADEQPGAENET